MLKINDKVYSLVPFEGKHIFVFFVASQPDKAYIWGILSEIYREDSDLSDLSAKFEEVPEERKQEVRKIVEEEFKERKIEFFSLPL